MRWVVRWVVRISESIPRVSKITRPYWSMPTKVFGARRSLARDLREKWWTVCGRSTFSCVARRIQWFQHRAGPPKKILVVLFSPQSGHSKQVEKLHTRFAQSLTNSEREDKSHGRVICDNGRCTRCAWCSDVAAAHNFLSFFLSFLGFQSLSTHPPRATGFGLLTLRIVCCRNRECIFPIFFWDRTSHRFEIGLQSMSDSNKAVRSRIRRVRRLISSKSTARLKTRISKTWKIQQR